MPSKPSWSMRCQSAMPSLNTAEAMCGSTSSPGRPGACVNSKIQGLITCPPGAFSFCLSGEHRLALLVAHAGEGTQDRHHFVRQEMHVAPPHAERHPIVVRGDQ